MEFREDQEFDKLRAAGFSEEDIVRLSEARDRYSISRPDEFLDAEERNTLRRLHRYHKLPAPNPLTGKVRSDRMPIAPETAESHYQKILSMYGCITDRIIHDPDASHNEMGVLTPGLPEVIIQTHTRSYSNEAGQFTVKYHQGGSLDGALQVEYKSSNDTNRRERVKIRKDMAVEYTPPEYYEEGTPIIFNTTTGYRQGFTAFQRTLSLLVPYIDEAPIPQGRV